MNLSLEGKTAIVCGSTQGIGKASALELASLGANIVLMARNEERLTKVTNELEKSPGQQHACLVADFSKPAEVREAIVGFVTKNPSVHILVNNTGGPPAGTAIDAAENDFISAFQSHLICNQILVKAVVPLMKKEAYGRIINIISTSVKTPIAGLGVSNTIRGAVANWSKTLAYELGGFGITVNNVLPGLTKTGRLEEIIEGRAIKFEKTEEEIEREWLEQIPARRFADPEEVAWAVAFLATPAAAYINGVNLPVDGGRTPSL
ncbi:MAG TPA: SDR family oxidoreductase [Cyclobacteriaceae bacterium]|jgi:3-oxoacyl-[acyl-carrier protein] reductase